MEEIEWEAGEVGFEDIQDAREYVRDLRERGWDARILVEDDDEPIIVVQRGRPVS